MSDFLGGVSTGLQQDGQRMVIAAVEGAGKSTFLADAPRVLFIPIELGYKSISVAKTDLIKSWPDFIALMDEIRNACMKGNFKFKSLAFDSATAIERLIHAQIIAEDPNVKKGIDKTPTMESVHGGYGKAYNLANQYFMDFLNRCDELTRYAKLNIIISCHVFPTLIKDAAYGEYNSWDLLLHSPKNDKTYGKRELITQWADLVGFLHEPLFVSKLEGASISRGVSAGQGRVLAVERTPGWVAKNRYDLIGDNSLIPIPRPNYEQGKGLGCWNALASRIYNAKGIDIFNRD